jgi:hypothetical protein
MEAPMEMMNPVLVESNPALDPNLYFEIVNGKRVSLDAKPIEAVTNASLLAVALYQELLSKAPGVFLFKPLIRFEEGQSRRPDLVYVTFESLNRDAYRMRRLLKQIEKKNYIETSFIPQMAIEMISPNITIGFVHERTERYLNAGVQSVWHVLYETKRVYVYESSKRLSIFGEEDVIQTNAFGAFSRTVGEWLTVAGPDQIIP